MAGSSDGGKATVNVHLSYRLHSNAGKYSYIKKTNMSEKKHFIVGLKAFKYTI